MKINLRSTLVFLASAGLVKVGSPINPPSIYTWANANYQALSGGTNSNTFTFPAANLPVTSSSRSYVPVSGFAGYGRTGHATLPDIECAWDDSDAFATATVPGMDGAYARAGGYSPQGGPVDCTATAKLVLTSNWLATAAAPATAVDLLFFLDGFLYTSKNSGLPTMLDASVETKVEVFSSLGNVTIFEATGSLNFASGFSSTFLTSNGWSNSLWNSSWANNSATLTSTNGVDRLYEVNYLENINDIVVVPTGEVFEVRYTLVTKALNLEGPFELFATSDFSHTSDVTLTSNTPGVDLREVNLVVPEPASMVALALGLAAVLRRRRVK